MPANWTRRRTIAAAVPVAALAVMGAAAVPMLNSRSGDLALTGLPPSATVGRQLAGDLTLVVHGKKLSGATVKIDGRTVPAQAAGDQLMVHPGALADGRHTVAVDARGSLFGGRSLNRQFTVDTTAPALTIDKPAKPASLRKPMDITGTVDPEATLTLGGKPVPVSGGRFTLHLDTSSAAAPLIATDKAGNTTTQPVDPAVAVPLTRAVHLTGLAWTAPGLREPVLAMGAAGKINAVEVDIKDEDGAISYASKVPLAQQIGATHTYYDAGMLTRLHGMGLRVIGRIVVFHDPALGKWAWQNGQHDMVLQDSGGQPWAGGYGNYSFTNFANDRVRQYNIDLASEAARMGFDDILYDYVRRPDGPLSKMRFPGLQQTPEQSIAAFVADSRTAVHAGGAYLGASVFGIAADRPTEVAQDIPAMGRSLDYVAPMVYPSHWGKGEYQVANPDAQPYDIVQRSLKAFQDRLKGTSCAVVPWLQDFSIGVHYGPAEVAAEIRGAHDDGIDSFILWNAGATYQQAAL
jgi:hypothetical protein